jgi:hypothetical protein
LRENGYESNKKKINSMTEKSGNDKANNIYMKMDKDEIFLLRKYASSCIWGEWGSYAPCGEAKTGVCKRLRVREP